MSVPMNHKNDDTHRQAGAISGDQDQTVDSDSGLHRLAEDHPTQIDQYLLKRVIASGGMGIVYEALQENPRRPVALKVIKGTLAGEEAVKRLEYEAQLLARLRHPGIAQIYAAGSYEHGGRSFPYFAMEYIPSAKSITRYARDKKLGTSEKLELFLQVCDAVHHGHQRGIVHRDLKPSNILVDSNGLAKIIDFGVARATDADMRQAAVQTQVGQIVGSIQYMSPEQFDADPHDIDTRSDVYALGLVLYELLSGMLPYLTSSDRLFDFAAEVREGRTTPLRMRDQSYDCELEAVVSKAMKRDREQRYQSAYGLAQDIRRYLAGDAVVARPPGLSYQFRVFARRNKAIIGLVASAFVLLIASVVVTTSLLVKVDQEREKEELASQKAAKGQQFLSDLLTSAFPPGFGDQITVLDVLDRSSDRLSGAFPDEPEIEADLRRSLGMAYLNIGHFEAAGRELSSALVLAERAWGKSDDRTLDLRGNLGTLYSVTDDRSGQLENSQAILAAMTERLGESDIEVLEYKGAVAGDLADVGRIGEAREMALEAWTGLKSRLGPDSSTTIFEQIRYCWLLFDSRRIKEAEELARDALVRSKKLATSDNDMRIRGAKSILAATFIVQNEFDSARALYGNTPAPDKFGIEHDFQGAFELNKEPFQLLVFFETWCPFSHQAMKRLEHVNRQYDQFGLNIVALTEVSRSSTIEGVSQYLKDNEISFAAFQESGRAWTYYGCNGTPSIRLLCKGYLIWEHVWPATDRIPTQILEALVAAQTCGVVPASSVN